LTSSGVETAGAAISELGYVTSLESKSGGYSAGVEGLMIERIELRTCLELYPPYSIASQRRD
jgi:hypothetical protein